eukprot:Rhum_TRINITY_DN4163_c0_g1::Rhum_TRINITY_DN4163_c0_g1_i1::g.13137::m.13137
MPWGLHPRVLAAQKQHLCDLKSDPSKTAGLVRWDVIEDIKKNKEENKRRKARFAPFDFASVLQELAELGADGCGPQGTADARLNKATSLAFIDVSALAKRSCAEVQRRPWQLPAPPSAAEAAKARRRRAATLPSSSHRGRSVAAAAAGQGVRSDTGAAVLSWSSKIEKLFPHWTVSPPPDVHIDHAEFLAMLQEDCHAGAAVLERLRLSRFRFTLATLAAFTASLHVTPLLSGLTVARSDIDDRLLLAIIHNMPATVQKLDLSYNRLSAEGILYIFKEYEECMPQLLSLSVHGNPGEGDATAMCRGAARFLCTQSELTEIDLSFCGVDDAGALEFAKELPRMHKGFRTLLLEGSAISLGAGVQLCEALKHNYWMTGLSLRQCRAIPAAVQRAVSVILDRNSASLRRTVMATHQHFTTFFVPKPPAAAATEGGGAAPAKQQQQVEWRRYRPFLSNDPSQKRLTFLEACDKDGAESSTTFSSVLQSGPDV